MRKLMCILMSVILIGMIGCGHQTEDVLETSNTQEPTTSDPSVLTIEITPIEETENLTTDTNTSLPDVYTTGNLSVEEKEALLSNLSGDNISPQEYETFSITADAKDAGGYDKFDDFAEVMNQDFIGTWYNPELGEAIRLTEEWAYVYIPYLDEYGDTPYEWELIDRSDRHLCPELAIYISGKDAGPLAYYVAGFRDDYFWCNSQMQLFYRQ